MNLNDVFFEVVSQSCLQSVNKPFRYKATNVSPEIAINERLLNISYINIIKKSKRILEDYYLGSRNRRRCISQIRDLGESRLLIKYRAVKVFPVFYSDLIALSEYCKMKDYKLVNIEIESAWTRFLSPYVYEVSKILKIPKYSKEFILGVINTLQQYKEILHLSRRPLGFIIRASTAYYSVIGKCYSMKESRYRYYYIRSRYDDYYKKYIPYILKYNVNDLKCIDAFTKRKIEELRSHLLTV